jgi:hypothetical protein
MDDPIFTEKFLNEQDGLGVPLRQQSSTTGSSEAYVRLLSTPLGETDILILPELLRDLSTPGLNRRMPISVRRLA